MTTRNKIKTKSSMNNSFEDSHVHSIYNLIADDFSRTRHKPWPFITNYLNSKPSNSIILDAGCGNGKYLNNYDNNNKMMMIGLDMSFNLLKIAVEKGHQVIQANCINLTSCFRPNSFVKLISSLIQFLF